MQILCRKSVIASIVAGVLGGIVGAFAILLVAPSSLKTADSLAVRELIIRDGEGNISLRLYHGEHGPTIALLDPVTQREAIRLRATSNSREFHYFTSEGDVATGLVSREPQMATTLYLGDRFVPARIILGAHPGDVSPASPESVPEWGLTMRNPRNLLEDLFRVMVLDSESRANASVNFHLMTSDTRKNAPKATPSRDARSK